MVSHCILHIYAGVRVIQRWYKNAHVMVMLRDPRRIYTPFSPSSDTLGFTCLFNVFIKCLLYTREFKERKFLVREREIKYERRKVKKHK